MHNYKQGMKNSASNFQEVFNGKVFLFAFSLTKKLFLILGK